MVVVQVHEDRGETQRLLAAVTARALADRSFETVEEPFEILGGPNASGCIGQPVHPLVGRAERARRATAAVIVAKSLIRPPLGALTNELRQLLLAVMRFEFLFGHKAPHSAFRTPNSAFRTPNSALRIRQNPLPSRSCNFSR